MAQPSAQNCPKGSCDMATVAFQLPTTPQSLGTIIWRCRKCGGHGTLSLDRNHLPTPTYGEGEVSESKVLPPEAIAEMPNMSVNEHFPDVQYHGGGPKPQIDKSCRIANGALLDTAAQITIKRFTFLGHRVMILTGSHNYHVFGADRFPAAKPKPVHIGEGVWICSGAIICPGVTVGDHAVVGPGAVVMRNVPPYTVVAGNPAQRVRRLRSTTHGTTQTAG